ncbi:bifunctional D-glycero-beta-D-manno-heptose-7-phosphate kinase/D-glycero-beta-D-manno-heptose 1-phosphate adenylyltransferase HldE [Ectothiorhodospiraceae bacterium BW-2]|nr:bifunctional D-glycero-beta-D-manno-heptose-7-phosphate kinase/D-glycero-beta-D-manno-heptose 1-phosphate adenylyltransferase HldE [Ectothiorhodospiraceae bacterium BW-2]
MQTLLLPPFHHHRVLVCGDLMLDRYWHGDTSRISPEAPVPVVNIGECEERPGGAANVALNLAALGCRVSLTGTTGDDEAAEALQLKLGHAQIECHFNRLKQHPTTVKLRVMSRHQQLIRLDIEQTLPPASQQQLLVRYHEQLSACDVVILSDYRKGTLAAPQPFISAARAAGKAVIIDPKGDDFTPYRGATLLTPNLHELERVVGSCPDEQTLVSRGSQLMEHLKLEALLITRSEAGMTLLEPNQPPFHCPTRAREVFDVTGAGDTVIATLGAALASGYSLKQATELANLAAGIVVGKLGTATVNTTELSQALRQQDSVDKGIVNETQLLALVQEAKAHGEKVVMTNGCFDILHAGHVTYLEEAARLGERLIVAINDDASVKRLKGEERPVNSQNRRMQVVAALHCVDWVVGFSEDTPTRLICAVTPDILVKGGDNDPDNIPGGECVRAAGGEVSVMSYLDNLSTTAIIGSIRTTKKRG